MEAPLAQAHTLAIVFFAGLLARESHLRSYLPSNSGGLRRGALAAFDPVDKLLRGPAYQERDPATGETTTKHRDALVTVVTAVVRALEVR